LGSSSSKTARKSASSRAAVSKSRFDEVAYGSFTNVLP
jgi:hypothetical protein